MDYFEAFPDLGETYLEDSWVLAVRPGESSVTFDVEVVLAERHPRYTPPKAGEQYCYANAQLIVSSSEELDLKLSGRLPATDANGDKDLGNIDSFSTTPDGRWHLEGEWGELDVTDPNVALRLR